MSDDLLSASSLYRDSNCFANRKMAKEAERLGVLPPAWTQFTERGNRVHAGEAATQDEQDACDYCSSLLDKEVRNQDGHQTWTKVAKEERLYLRDGLVPYFSGQPDIVWTFRDRIIFGDYKPGFEADWEAWEDQMRAYACLIYENLWRKGIEKIIGIISTRFYGTKTFGYQLDKLPESVEAINSVAERHADTSRAIPVAGPWCRYCKARLICKESLARPLALYQQPVEQLPAGLEGALVVDKLKLVIKIANDRLAYYRLKMLSDPNFLGGDWILGTRKTRSVLDTKPAASALVESGLMSRDGVMSCMKLSLPDAQKIMRITNAGMTANAAKDALVEVLGNLLVVQESEPFLVKSKEPKEID